MLLRPAFALLVILILGIAHAQTDDDLLEKLRENAERLFLEQASFTLPESFLSSDMAEPDKELLIKQWANESAKCLAGAVALYATTSDVPLSEMISDDGSFRLKGDGSRPEFETYRDSCLKNSWASVGAQPYE